MYYIVEVFSRLMKQVAKTEDYDTAWILAYRHAARSETLVEIRDELGRVLDTVQVRRA